MMTSNLHLDTVDPPVSHHVTTEAGRAPYATLRIGQLGPLGGVTIFSSEPAALEHIAKVAKKAARELTVAKVLSSAYESLAEVRRLEELGEAA